jgi:hypothetical protein
LLTSVLFCLFACCSYNKQLEEIVDNADEDIKEQCTVDGEVDIGCVIDGVTLGTEAADLYLEVIENANTVSITESPTSGPTSAPTAGPTSAPTSGPTSAPTSGPTSAPTGQLSESSGSQGDPHCK